MATPYIILPQNEDVNQLVKHLYIKTSPFVLIGALDAVHEYTEYQISKNILFTDIVDTNYVRDTKTDIVLSNLILGYDTEYYIRANKTQSFGCSFNKAIMCFSLLLLSLFNCG